MPKLSDSIACLKGVGQRRAELYKKLGVDTIYSLLRFYPRDYLDLSNPVEITQSLLNENNVIKATVCKKNAEQRIRKGLSIFKAIVSDKTTDMSVTIFNSKYKFDELVIGEEYYFYGKVTGSLLKREMTSPNFLKAEEEGALLRPVYSLTEGISNKLVQTHMRESLEVWGDCLTDVLPVEIKQEHNLCQLRYAIENIHFPKDGQAFNIAKERLIFEELLVLQLGMAMLRNKKRTETSVQLDNTEIPEFYSSLPFILTNGQRQAIKDGLSDMTRAVPMNRLCQGDVGSGKTMVAAGLCYASHKNGYQSVIMAPTQVLADQHYETLSKLLEPLGVKCCIVTGMLKTAQRRRTYEGIASGEFSVVIGTHALLQETVIFNNLGLVVTDEQHRFGVAQRAVLANKGNNPHMLVMSATPIPRTLALIIYGDLDVSVISELPKGRLPIETYAVSSNKRVRALNFIKKHIDEGRQAYIVCPAIEESEIDVVSTSEYIEALKSTPLSDYHIAGLNGRLKPVQKDEIMTAFKKREIDILVSTTVIEVGVDVPNANIILIENAERFGLSQLHQLRGRVGRGEYQSYCILVSDNQGEENRERLKVMSTTTDGFVIAEQDLKLRGPGDFFGNKQHGLPALKIANLVDNVDVLKLTQQLAVEILEKDNLLEQVENKGLRKQVKLLFDNSEQSILN